MTPPAGRSDIRLRLDELLAAIDAGTLAPVKRLLSHLRAVDVAHLLESSPPRARHILWQLIDAEQEGEVLQELGDDVKGALLDGQTKPGAATLRRVV
mgnify:CR=1 FL=1